MRAARVGLAVCCLALPGLARPWADLIDKPAAEDRTGFWAAFPTPWFPATLIGVTLGGAVWEGDRSRLGRTLWQSLDAVAMAGAATQGLKMTFTRARPYQTGDPHDWFMGPGHASFPSGDVSATASLVTPLIMEYGRDDWWVWGLVALPACDMVARVKYRAHWETDVVGGAVVGVAAGWGAREMPDPLTVRLLPDGWRVGLKQAF